jgi:hypothetical protein
MPNLMFLNDEDTYTDVWGCKIVNVTDEVLDALEQGVPLWSLQRDERFRDQIEVVTEFN